jgi:DNA-binding response OmpR family regulator
MPIDLISNIKLKNTTDSLTKKEKALLALLLISKGNLVTYWMIEQRIYKDKSMSMDGLRALIGRLRAKLAENIIQNVPEEGCVLNTK